METNILQGIDTVIVRVSDINKSKTWYTDKLGLKQIHEDEKLKLVVINTYSPVSLTIWETKDKIQNNPNTTTYPIFRAMNAEAAHRFLNNNGVKTGDIITDHVVTYFTFYDLDNNLLEVCQVHN